jgi:hypothetical protein
MRRVGLNSSTIGWCVALARSGKRPVLRLRGQERCSRVSCNPLRVSAFWRICLVRAAQAKGRLPPRSRRSQTIARRTRSGHGRELSRGQPDFCIGERKRHFNLGTKRQALNNRSKGTSQCSRKEALLCRAPGLARRAAARHWRQDRAHRGRPGHLRRLRRLQSSCVKSPPGVPSRPVAGNEPAVADLCEGGNLKSQGYCNPATSQTRNITLRSVIRRSKLSLGRDSVPLNPSRNFLAETVSGSGRWGVGGSRRSVLGFQKMRNG